MKFEPNKTAIVFPGQGSQQVGMGKELAQAYPVAQQIFQQADEALGLNFSQIAWEGPEAELNDTYNTQPALFIHALAAWQVFQEVYPGFQPAFMAGHSLGELSALTAAGAIDFSTGLNLVRRRGELMKAAGDISPGGMAAFLGLDIATVEQVCQQASTTESIAQVANDNCPGQVVISGHTDAVARAIDLAKEAGAKRALPLTVSIAAHSSLMAHAQADFNTAVSATNFAPPAIPVIGNVAAQTLQTVADIEADLRAQLSKRVRWTESIQFMLAQGVDTFIELGTGNVLSGLIKRIDRKAARHALGTAENFANLSE